MRIVCYNDDAFSSRDIVLDAALMPGANVLWCPKWGAVTAFGVIIAVEPDDRTFIVLWA